MNGMEPTSKFHRVLSEELTSASAALQADPEARKKEKGVYRFKHPYLAEAGATSVEMSGGTNTPTVLTVTFEPKKYDFSKALRQAQKEPVAEWLLPFKVEYAMHEDRVRLEDQLRQRGFPGVRVPGILYRLAAEGRRMFAVHRTLETSKGTGELLYFYGPDGKPIVTLSAGWTPELGAKGKVQHEIFLSNPDADKLLPLLFARKFIKHE